MPLFQAAGFARGKLARKSDRSLIKVIMFLTSCQLDQNGQQLPRARLWVVGGERRC
jgi:hypothetical protein